MKSSPSHLSNLNLSIIIITLANSRVVCGVDCVFQHRIARRKIDQVRALNRVATRESEHACASNHRKLPRRIENLVPAENAERAARVPTHGEVEVEVHMDAERGEVGVGGEALGPAQRPRVEGGPLRD